MHDSFCEEWEFRDNLPGCRYFWSASLDMPTQRSNVSGRPRTNFPRKLSKENITAVLQIKRNKIETFKAIC